MDVELMYKQASLVTQLIASSVNISKRAGKIIQSTLGTDLKIVQKSCVTDLQTIADRRAQQCILGSLRKKFGLDLTVIGEEDEDYANEEKLEILESSVDPSVLALESSCPSEFKNVDKKDIVVWVDPLDGTSEFTEGFLSHVTVLIGISVKGKAVAGVIHQPFFGYDDKNVPAENWGRTVWGIQGMGAHGLHPKVLPKDIRIIATTRSHYDKIVASAIDAMKPDKILRVGGCGHKVLLIIEAYAHAYVFASKGCKKWDTCAPDAILSALGGRLTDLVGCNLQYGATVEKSNSSGVLATPPGVDHQWYVDRIPDDLKQSLPFK